MKTIKIDLAGKDYYLAFTGAAKYKLEDLCGEQSILELTQPDTRESFGYLCKAVAILTEQGELARRFMGYDKSTYLSAEAIEAILLPKDILIVKTGLAHAILLGYGREIEDEKKEVDLVLQELEKKTAIG